ncbi:MAG: hypothetical protein Kow0068_13030 [Marinilabiliales bacterium]
MTQKISQITLLKSNIYSLLNLFWLNLYFFVNIMVLLKIKDGKSILLKNNSLIVVNFAENYDIWLISPDLLIL